MLKARWRQGRRTLPIPTELPAPFRGRPGFTRVCEEQCHACEDACPTGAIRTQPLRLDLGACLFCPACAEACTHGNIRWTGDVRLATRRRADLVLAGGEMTHAHALETRIRTMFGRSLKLRQVSAGGCNGCEAELNASGNIIFDLSRYGIQFVASPRHADGIVITGPVSKNMRQALLDTYAATPSPRLVIAVGACAISGGAFAGSEQVAGIPPEIAVDLYVPGCPPHPATFADGLMRMLALRQP